MRMVERKDGQARRVWVFDLWVFDVDGPANWRYRSVFTWRAA